VWGDTRLPVRRRGNGVVEDLEKKIVQRLDRVIEKMELLVSGLNNQHAVLERLDRIELALITHDLNRSGDH
jgi:hypothetical protein